MASFYAYFPPGGGSNPANGTPGSTAPTTATEVAGVNPSGNLQPLQTDSAGNLLVDIASPVTISENIAQFGGNNVVTGTGASGLGIPRVTVSNDSSVLVSNFPATQAVSAASLPLPTGASTSALQTTGNSSLSSIATNTANIPPLGQALAAASVPVVLTASQISTLTPLSSVTVTQATASNLNATVAIASAQTLANVTTLGTITNALPSGTNTLGSIANISGTVSLPTGASTSALQTTGNSSLATIATNTTGVSTAANQTNVQSAVGTSATTAITVQGSSSGVALPISAASLPLPSGAATSALQTTGNTSLATIATNTTGAATAANQTNVQSAVGTSATTAITIQGSASGVSVITNARQTGTFTDRSGTTSGTASTSTQVAASNTSRKYFIIQNVSTTATIWVNFTTAATATEPSIQLLPGGSFVMESGFVSTEAINVLSTTASVPYSAKEA